jgi:hypothetical protein
VTVVQLHRGPAGRGPVRVVEAQGEALAVQVRAVDLGPPGRRDDVGPGDPVPASVSPTASAIAVDPAQRELRLVGVVGRLRDQHQAERLLGVDPRPAGTSARIVGR